VRPARRAWVEGFAIGAVAFAAIPVANAVMTARGLPGSLSNGDTLFASFDIAMLGVAGVLAFGAVRAGRKVKMPVRRRVREMAHV